MPRDEHVQDGYAFAIPDLYKTSSLAHIEVLSPSLEDFQPLALPKEPQLELQFGEEPKSGLLDLQPFEFGPVEDVGVLEDSSIVSLETLDPSEVVDEDVWASLQSNKSVSIAPNLKSWEAFYGQQSKGRPCNLFLSEAGPQAFDAALVNSVGHAARDSASSVTACVVQSEALLSSLIQLALGRESVLYYYDTEEKSFRLRKNNVRMSGYSSQTFDSLGTRLQNHGNSLRDLRGFVSETQGSSKACRARFALAAAFVPILDALEYQVAFPSSPFCSLLQLQASIERPGQILQCLNEAVSKIRGTQTDEQLISKVFELLQSSEHSPAGILQILRELFVSASEPWLDSVNNWLGLKDQSNLSYPTRFPDFTLARNIDTNAVVDLATSADKFDFIPSLVPSVVSPEDAQTLFETGKSLRLLEAHQPNHPLVMQSRFAGEDTVDLRWHFTWADIEAVTAKANVYESRLRKALKDFYCTSRQTDQVLSYQQNLLSTNHADFNVSKESAQLFIENSKLLFEKALPDISSSQTFIADVDNRNQSEHFTLPLSLLSTLSFNPVMSACVRLIDHASLRLLFKDHHLRAHLRLLYCFNLMSDGLFATRLSHALFSPRLSTTERRPGHSRSGPLGLKLGHRDAWPPASSELRLALTGIIADTYFKSTQTPLRSSLYSADLPGDLSFAIRSMSPHDLEKCSDPNALFALDFLRIQYTPVAPLNSIITPKSLEKYDCIFKHLLRCRRVLFVVAQLIFPPRRSSSRGDISKNSGHRRVIAFQNESHHFVTTVCSHFFNNVSSHWQQLDQRLEALEHTTDSDSEYISSEGIKDTTTEPEKINSIHALRIFHEHLLDSMMLALLLRRRQEQVMALLEEIWGIVLRFAWLLNRSDDGSPGTHSHTHSRPQPSNRAVESTADTTKPDTDGEIAQLHAQFRRKARVFVEVCRGLSDRTPKDRDMAGMGLGMEYLVLMFDMNGFYTRT